MQRDVQEGKTLYHLTRSGPMYKRWAELLTRGAEKYDEDNWMKADSPEELARFRASAVRHFEQWLAGDTDEDHAAAVMFNINGAEYVKARRVPEFWPGRPLDEFLDAPGGHALGGPATARGDAVS
jgi:hypothetical protein